MAELSLTSSAFTEGAPIPAKYTGDGEDLSPPLSWSGELPAGTKVLALIMDDPDAPSGTFTHWLVYDMPPTTTELPAGVDPDAMLPHDGGIQGTNDFRKIGYGGPAPPPGKVHHYRFTLYCLNASLGLEPAARRQQVERALQGHVLAKAELMGTYER